MESADQTPVQGSVEDPSPSHGAGRTPSLPRAVQATRPLRDVAPAPRRVKSGPVAAVAATVAILAATALPSTATFPAGPFAPAPVVRALAPASVTAFSDVKAFQLSQTFAPLDLVPVAAEDGALWLDREDGTASLRVKLVDPADASTSLEGILNLRGRVSMAEIEAGMQGLLDSSVEHAADGYGYAALHGQMMGRGKLDGVVITVSNRPGTTVRRGSWIGQAESIDDAVFGRLTWLREMEPRGTETVGAYGTGVIAMGLGAVAEDVTLR